MTRLRLGPIEDEKPVKLTLELPGEIFRMLTDYAQAHARAHGLQAPLPPERLIAPMIERFMVTDRGFSRARKRQLD